MTFQLGAQAPPDTVMGVQQRLHQLGYYQGPRDGVESSEMREAVRRFHISEGMKPTGTASQETYDRLEQKAGLIGK